MASRTGATSTRLDLAVTVAGRAWQRVDGFREAAASAAVFTVHVGGDGAAQVAFGNGMHGQRPPAGATIAASYSAGGGRAGRVGQVAPLSGDVAGLQVRLPLKPVEVSPHEPRRRWPPW